jgi:hypothetical protein
VPKAQALVAALVAAKPSNLLLEAGNEPEVQTAPNHNYDTGVLRSTLESSGFQSASGNYTGGAARWYGSYLTTHSARSVEWPRYAHDCYDYWVKPSDAPAGAIAVHAPCVLDEPAKPTSGGLGGTSKADDWTAYFGGAGIFAAGATFHSETGLDGLPPTADERALAVAALNGLVAFPADAPNAQSTYRRIDGDGLRTYVIGDSMVRIRPNRPQSPEAGWTAIDGAGVLWRR